MKTGKIISLLLAGMLSVSSVCFADSAIDYSSLLKYELEPEGSLSEENINLSFSYDSLLNRGSESYDFLSTAGDVLVSNISNTEYLENGLYAVRGQFETDDVNKTGLFTAEGETLIPEEAAAVYLPDNRKDGSARFLGVIYATETTDNKDECIIYFTDNFVSFDVGEDDTMYKGYAKIFDLEKKAFVEGVEPASFYSGDFYDLGDSFVLSGGGSTDMYDPDGNKIWSSTGYCSGCTADGLAIRIDNKNYIVNSAGQDVFKTDFSVDPLNTGLNYFKLYNNDEKGYQAVDMNGNPVLDGFYSSIYQTNGYVFNVSPVSEDEAEKDKELYVTADGTVLSENAEYLDVTLGGYGTARMEDSDKAALVTPNGFYDDLEDGGHLQFGPEKTFAVLNTGELSLTFDEETSVGRLKDGMIAVAEKNSSGTVCSAYDLFTGEQILPAEYDAIQVAGNHLFAQKATSSGGHVWDVFKIHLVPAA